MGFPTELRTNSSEIVRLFGERWGMCLTATCDGVDPQTFMLWMQRLPGVPTDTVISHYAAAADGVVDAHNYSIGDLARNHIYVSVSRTTLRSSFLSEELFLGAPGNCVATRYATPIHAGCVSLDGHGMLLCGDSGAGKSTLSYACAQAGWTFTSDDGSYVSNDGNELIATGDHHQVRFRPSAEEIFPEIKGLEVSRRAAGKPSIELPMIPMSNISCSQTAQLRFIVFLNRQAGGQHELLPYSKDVARYSMMQTVYGLPETRAKQYATIERLLALDVFELRYNELDWAIQRLQKLVREGH